MGAGTLRKLQLRDGDANSTGEAGGALSVDGNATLVRSRIKAQRRRRTWAAGSSSPTARLELRRSVVRRNVAGGEGGGIFVNDDATVRARDSTLARNEADEGGGVFSESEARGQPDRGFDRLPATRRRRRAAGSGTAGRRLFVRNSTVADNTADGSGGGLYAAPDSGTALEFVTIARNRADADDTGPHGGGGIFADGGDDVVGAVGSLFARNRTTGGAFQDCDAPAPVGIVELRRQPDHDRAGLPVLRRRRRTSSTTSR